MNIFVFRSRTNNPIEIDYQEVFPNFIRADDYDLIYRDNVERKTLSAALRFVNRTIKGGLRELDVFYFPPTFYYFISERSFIALDGRISELFQRKREKIE